MIFKQTIKQNGHEIVLRTAQHEDAALLVDYLVTVSGETRFLLCDPDEIHYTQEQECAYIDTNNADPRAMLLLVFVDGEYAGNGSFTAQGPSRRHAHRADLGIALFQKYTGQGIGTLLMQTLLSHMRAVGFEQCELTVVSTNTRARHLYEKLGFVECGRLPRANKYTDGTYSDDIYMVLDLRDIQILP